MLCRKESVKIEQFKPYFSNQSRERILHDIDGILSSGNLMLGPFKDRFESVFRETMKIPYAVSVNSCTTALIICLSYFDVRDREVLVPSGSFVTSVSSIIFAGAKPVLVDMNPATLSFDLCDLERKITPRTKGAVWVHLTGMISAEYRDIIRLVKDKGLFLIEDCAHALGASTGTRGAGTLGDAGCFSFYPTKIITSGTGGMITTRDRDLKAFGEKMRLFGKDSKSGLVMHLGNDWFLDEIRACVGYHQMTELESNLKRRRQIAKRYREALDNRQGLKTLSVPEENRPSYYQFPIFLDSEADTVKLTKALKGRWEISVKNIYKPCHQEHVFREFDDGSLKKTEETLNRSLCLPLYLDMTDWEIDYVIKALVEEVTAVRLR